jgi:3-oxoacyl-[acyl-carrier protein] reductase
MLRLLLQGPPTLRPLSVPVVTTGATAARGRHTPIMVTASGEPGDRVAIVTGGSRGIGRETIRRLANRAYAVVVGYAHDQRAAESTVEEVLAGHGNAVAIRADVTDDLDVERLFAETTHTFAGVDVVVHAVHKPVDGNPIAEVDLDHFDALCLATIRSTFIVNRQAARQVRDGGAIVNLSSTAAGVVFPTHAVEAASGAAIDTLTRALALELHDRNIAVNSVSLKVDKPCTPGRVADVIDYLLSDEGHAVTGQVMDIEHQ